MTENYYEWLKNLKPGDKVAVSGSFLNNWRTLIVKKVTPTGRIIAIDQNDIEYKFDNRGSSSMDRGAFSRSSISPITQEMLAKKMKDNYTYNVESFNFKALTLEQIAMVSNLLDSMKPEKSDDGTK